MPPLDLKSAKANLSKPTRAGVLAVIALLLVGLSWGGSFVWMKDAIVKQPPADFLATRFSLAALLMIAVRPSVLKALTRQNLLRGTILGSILGVGYITQTIGLSLTTAAITGFITGLYVVVTPILAWLLFRERVTKKVFIGVALALVGLGFISINGLSVEPNHLWVVVSAIMFAAHIVGLGRWSPGSDVYALTVVQLATAAVLAWVLALGDGYQAPPSIDVWGAIWFTVIFATAFAFLVQTWAQSVMNASRVAIILTSEVVFAALISVAVGQETLLPRVVIGGALMVVAMLVVEWPSKA